ncbi:MAG: M20 family metallopeptidase [Peptoniphilaceae bacterium]|nr:M20 family metallopeptidase [Peptoniphilaceae bacterium]MDY6019213.1 M20 family metallopeptidase [Anaerococcus sp.]
MDSISLAKENQDLCVKMRRDLHMIPELELDLPKTSSYVKEKLEEFGISYEEYINGNGIVATIKGNGEGKCLAIRADMDALPVLEQTGAHYASTHPGKMHACGHDSHTAIALTAAKIVKENSDKFKGYVKFIFQPGEEIPGGAKPMIDQGALKNPDVDFVVGMHGGRLADEKIGTFGFKKNEMMAAMDTFEIDVLGKSGHGASPNEAIDPIVVAAEIISSLQTIISRDISPVENGVISVCKIEGGSSQNIIPDKVHMLGTARSLNEDVRDIIEKRISEVSEAIALAHGAKAKVTYKRYYPVVDNDPEFTERVKAIAENLFPGQSLYLKRPTMGGEDFAFYGKEVPATFIFFTNPKVYEDGSIYPNHNCKFDLDESSFYKAVALFVETVFKVLN